MSEANLKAILEVQDKFSQTLAKFEQATQKAAQQIDNLQKNSAKANTEGSKFNSGMLAQAISLGVVTTAAYKALKAFDDKNKILKQTSALLNATGYTSGMTARAMIDLADSLEELTGIDADDILGGENTLLTFKRIGKEVFPEATKAMVDLAAKMNGDVAGAARIVGKALNNPIDGVTALKKAGIDLSVTQEKQIKNFQATGQLAKAQKVVLEELKKTYGGLAEEMASPLDKAKIAFGDIFEVVGEKLMPTFKDLVNNVLTPMVSLIKNCTSGFFLLASSISAIGLSLTVLTGPIGIVSALVTVGVAVYSLRNKFREAFTEMATLVTSGVISAIDSFTSFIGLQFVDDLMAPILRRLREYNSSFIEGKMQSVKEAELIEAEAANKSLADAKKSDDEMLEQLINTKTKTVKEKQDLFDQIELMEEENFNRRIYRYSQFLKSQQLKETEATNKKGKTGQDKANRDAKDDATKDLREELEKQEKEWEKHYGKLDDDQKVYLKNKIKTEQKANKDGLDDEILYEKDFAKEKLIIWSQVAKKNTGDQKKDDRNYQKALDKRIDWVKQAKEAEVAEEDSNAQRKFAIENNLGHARRELAMETMNTLSTLMQSKTRELFEIGKASAIAEATINTYLAVTKTMSSVPYPLNIPLAVAQGLAGMVQVQNISSQEPAFEQGGIVGGSSYTGDKIGIRVNSGERISTAQEQKEQNYIYDSIKNGGLGGKQSIYTDNRRINIVVKGGNKEAVEQIKKVLEDDKKQKARYDQITKGRR